MNKKLLAVAIGAALAGSISIAQADVQLYGQADVSVDSHDCDTGGCAGYASFNKGYTNNDGSQKMNMNGNFSYIGVKGSEDLGNGLKAIFNVMFAYDPAGNNTAGYGSNNTISDNEKWVGLAGDFGTFRAGTVTTPYSDHGAMIDPFFGTSLEGNQSGLQSNFLHSEYTAGDMSQWPVEPDGSLRLSGHERSRWRCVLHLGWSAAASIPPVTRTTRTAWAFTTRMATSLGSLTT